MRFKIKLRLELNINSIQNKIRANNAILICLILFILIGYIQNQILSA